MEEGQPEKTKKSVNPLIFVFIVAVLGAGLTFILSKSSNKQEDVKASIRQAESVSSSPIPAESKNSEDSNEGKTIEIEAGSFYFKPTEIRVKKGEKVKIVFKSVNMMHDFNIDELNVRLPITQSGQTTTVEFVAEKVGIFEYYCSVGQHRQMGQVGKLIVEE